MLADLPKEYGRKEACCAEWWSPSYYPFHCWTVLNVVIFLSVSVSNVGIRRV